MVPLAGMVFANGMNAISLAAERFESERQQGVDIHRARSTALQTALIPITNGLLAVGLVSIPGMMTGQVLSGVSPFIAARYQIMVMLMELLQDSLTYAPLYEQQIVFPCLLMILKIIYLVLSIPDGKAVN